MQDVVKTSAASLIFAAGLLGASPAVAYEASAVAGGGAVSGRVVFHGAAPTREVIPNKDVDVCGAAREDTLIPAGADGGVANTLVYLANVDKGKAWPALSGTPALNNVHCRFQPEIQVIAPGNIAIVNKDPVLHNTHGYYGKRTAFNTALPNQDQSITVELLKTGTVRVDCDAHGWMEGWVFVRDNPYYAVTGEDGKFTISDVPPGSYTLVTLQPYADLVEQPVTVASGQQNDLTIEIKAH